MVWFRIGAVAVAVGTMAWAAEASAGWFIEQVVRGAGADTRQQMLVQANMLKTVIHGDDGRPSFAFMLDLNAQTITQIDYHERRYVTGPIREFSEMMGRMTASMTQHMAEAMKHMQESLKQMPPEQRKMMEEMMRSRMLQAPPPAKECREPTVELRKRNERATIAGYPAVRYDVLSDGRLQSEIWVTPALDVWQEVDVETLGQFSTEMARVAGRCATGRRARGIPGEDPSWKLIGEGYPVRMIHKGDANADIVVEVVRAEKRSFPATEFQPPPGFARKTFREMRGSGE